MEILVSVLIIALAVGSLIAFVAIYRAEGLAALYMLGLPLLIYVVERLHITWSTAMSGLMYPILFVPLAIWWFSAKPRPGDVIVPRKFSLAMVIILMLVGLWEAKHWFEKSFFLAMTPYEAFKWAYMIARWCMPFILGFLFPLSLRTLRRFLAACGMLGLVTAVIILASYFSGARDFSDWGDRYTPMDRIGGLSVAINCCAGGAGLLAYWFMANRERKSMVRTILVYVSLAFMVLTILLTGSRGPLLALLATGTLMLFLSGTRGAVGIAVAMLAVVAILVAMWSILPESTIRRLFGEAGSGGSGLSGGAEVRWLLLKDSLGILKVSPILGQTLGLSLVIGGDYCHNFTVQFMVELGLLGLLAYLIAVTPHLFGALRLAFRRGTDASLFAGPLMVFFIGVYIEHHAAGELASAYVWMLLGIILGHALKAPYVIGQSAEEPAEEMPFADAQAFA